MNSPLPIIESCDGCGACCMRTPVPPFQPGEEYEKDVPAHLLQLIADRIAADQHFDLVSCVWFDDQQRRCQHYELRPEACRSFQVASDACRMSRWDVGIDV
ncbi:MAG: YkgJ family cysteine cluster protein [Fuerstiella sp.]